MDYHGKNISEDGFIRIPAYGSALKNIEEKWPIFKDKTRNGRLSLEADGFIHLVRFILLTHRGLF